MRPAAACLWRAATTNLGLGRWPRHHSGEGALHSGLLEYRGRKRGPGVWRAARPAALHRLPATTGSAGGPARPGVARVTLGGRCGGGGRWRALGRRGGPSHPHLPPFLCSLFFNEFATTRSIPYKPTSNDFFLRVFLSTTPLSIPGPRCAPHLPPLFPFLVFHCFPRPLFYVPHPLCAGGAGATGRYGGAAVPTRGPGRDWAQQRFRRRRCFPAVLVCPHQAPAAVMLASSFTTKHREKGPILTIAVKAFVILRWPEGPKS